LRNYASRRDGQSDRSSVGSGGAGIKTDPTFSRSFVRPGKNTAAPVLHIHFL